MDLGTAIISLVMLAIAIMPFAWVRIINKKKQQQLLQALQQLANKHNCTISNHECVRDFIIGIDEASNHLFYYKKTQGGEITRQIKLADIRNCKVVNIGHTGNHHGIGKLELSFAPNAHNEPPVVWVLYDAEESLQLQGELQAANKWAKLVNERLAGKAHPLAHAGVE
jgi:hypothetical protein